MYAFFLLTSLIMYMYAFFLWQSPFLCGRFSLCIHGKKSLFFGEGKDSGGTHSIGSWGIFQFQLLIERCKGPAYKDVQRSCKGQWGE